MRIQTKVTALLGALFLVLTVGQYWVQRAILLPSFSDLERQAASKDMDRVVHVLDRELEALSVTDRDWSNWSETWLFMQDHASGYVTKNLNEDAIASLGVNALAFFDNNGHLVWSAGRESHTRKVLLIDVLSDQGVNAYPALKDAIRSGLPMAGMTRTNLGPMLTVLAPVLNGFGVGPKRGMVLLGRLVTDEELVRIGNQAQVRLSRVADPSADLAVSAPERILEDNKATMEVTRQLPDVGGKTAMTVRIDVPRSITARGRDAVMYASILIAAIGAAVLILILVLLHKLALAPLSLITRHVTQVGRTDDLNARLDLQRSDEFGNLAQEFDRMVAALADARRRLLDRSFEAGVAENASGVLHNLGNAMTPLSVRVSALQDLLHTAPIADVELALTELERCSADRARTADLVEFLRLAGRELATVNKLALTHVDEIADSAALIQRVLTGQRAESRAERVLEPVELPALLADCFKLVPPALRERLRIEIEPSVVEVGVVCLVRSTMQQVVQNLTVNAAEAMADAGRERGFLRIGARRTSGPGANLELWFTDNGGGIQPDVLARIFDKGYSTKSNATNSGIGLHWSANALVALGGRLVVESAGHAQGSTFRIILPLLREADGSLCQVA